MVPMRIILRRRIRPISGNHLADYRQLVLMVSRLTIGQAADQHVHIEHAEVAARHAILYLDRGRLRVRAVGARFVTVNGRARRGAQLSEGDVMTFGVSRLTVEQLRPDGVIVLRHNDPQALSTTRVEAAAGYSLKGAGLSARSWSWYLVLTVLCLGFLAPLATALVSAIRPVVRESARLQCLPHRTLQARGEPGVRVLSSRGASTCTGRLSPSKAVRRRAVHRLSS
jgi:hypothetical protein